VREETKAARESKKKKGAAAGSDDEDGDDYDAEYDDEYGDYGDEDDADGAEEINTPAPGAPAAGSQNTNDQPFAINKLSAKQRKADKLISDRYPKFAEAVKVLELLREKYP
jgi:hypothetical protein